jgi:hypothetical protein
VAEVVELTHHYNITLSTQLGTALINAYRRVRCWEQQQPQQQQQQQHGSAGGKHGGSGGRKRGGRGTTRAAAAAVAAESAVSSADGSSSSSFDEAADVPEQQQQQQEEAAAAHAAWEQQQLAAMGAPQLPGVSPVLSAALFAAQQVLEALQQYKLATSNSYVTMMCFLLEQGQVAAFKQLHVRMTQQYGVGIDEQGWEKLAFAAAECGAGAIVASLQNQGQQPVLLSPQQQALEEQQQQRLRQRQQQIAQQRQSAGAARQFRS